MKGVSVGDEVPMLSVEHIGTAADQVDINGV